MPESNFCQVQLMSVEPLPEETDIDYLEESGELVIDCGEYEFNRIRSFLIESYFPDEEQVDVPITSIRISQKFNEPVSSGNLLVSGLSGVMFNILVILVPVSIGIAYLLAGIVSFFE